MRPIFTLLFALVALFCSAQQKTITVNGETRNYIQYVPTNLGTNRALLISCHGMNQDAAYQKNMLQIETIADKEKFVTVFPNGINKGWDISGDRDINFVLAIIDKMAQEYQIDRNRVYLSGFSMGGMFTYHAMTKIADKIAAFAPISGYPMYGMTCTSARPVPIIHTHGLADDVCRYNETLTNTLNGWIKRNNCNTTPTITKNYGGYSHITRKEWGGGTNGVKVVLMELTGKGHWVSNDGLKTGDEIWKFCKNYSLNTKAPEVTITFPAANQTVGDSFTAKATATDKYGTITKLTFFIDNINRGVATAEPYTCDIEGLSNGTHTLIVQAIDDNGYKKSQKITFTVDKTTGIVDIIADAANAAEKIYDINGTMVMNPQKGNVYIVNGKKVSF